MVSCCLILLVLNIILGEIPKTGVGKFNEKELAKPMPEPIMPSTSISVPSPLGRGQVIGTVPWQEAEG